MQCCIFGHGARNCTKKTENAKVCVPKKKETDIIKEDKKEVQELVIQGENVESSSKKSKPLNPSECCDSKSSANGKSGSVNRFAILESAVDVENPEDLLGADMGQRKTRAASAGVADLMKTLKPQKKGPDRGENVKASSSASGGQIPSLSS
ncbi:hypothetical protein DITRI_Ditri09bG0019500 [Diplodiscus trichospermus]